MEERYLCQCRRSEHIKHEVGMLVVSKQRVAAVDEIHANVGIVGDQRALLHALIPRMRPILDVLSQRAAMRLEC